LATGTFLRFDDVVNRRVDSRDAEDLGRCQRRGSAQAMLAPDLMNDFYRDPIGILYDTANVVGLTWKVLPKISDHDALAEIYDREWTWLIDLD